MKSLIRTLDRILTPVLCLTTFALCLILLAGTEKEARLSLFLSMLWAGGMCLLMRWGIWGILNLARGPFRASRRDIKILVRTVELLELLLIGASVTVSILLRDVPSAWLFLPTACFGLQGAIKFDARYLI